jgi:hypothetical protein
MKKIMFLVLSVLSFQLFSADFAEIIYKRENSQAIHVDIFPGPIVGGKMMGMNYSYENRIINIYPENSPGNNVVTTIDTLKQLQTQFSNEGGISGAANILIFTQLPLSIQKATGGALPGSSALVLVSRLTLLTYGLLGKDMLTGLSDTSWDEKNNYNDFFEKYEKLSLRSILDFSNPIPEIIKAKIMDSLISDFIGIELNCQTKVKNSSRNFIKDSHTLGPWLKATGFNHDKYTFLRDILNNFTSELL